MYPVAFNYGKTTETWIGNWLARRIGDGAVKREDLYFATKCNPLGTGGTVGKQGKWKKHAFDADRLRASCEASLSSCLLYTSPSPRDATLSRMPSSA